jgi:uncharacterized protein YjiS (DUF1127 family)
MIKMHASHALIAIVCDAEKPYLMLMDGQYRPRQSSASGDVEMATIFTRAAVAPFGAITIHRIVAGLMSAAADLRAWNETRRTINALRALSPAQLDDIGLTRAEVENFGLKGR